MSWNDQMLAPVPVPAALLDRFQLGEDDLLNLSFDDTKAVKDEYPPGQKERLVYQTDRDALADLAAHQRVHNLALKKHLVVLPSRPVPALNQHSSRRKRLPTGAELAEQEERRKIWAQRQRERDAAHAVTQEAAERAERNHDGSQLAPLVISDTDSKRKLSTPRESGSKNESQTSLRSSPESSDGGEEGGEDDNDELHCSKRERRRAHKAAETS